MIDVYVTTFTDGVRFVSCDETDARRFDGGTVTLVDVRGAPKPRNTSRTIANERVVWDAGSLLRLRRERNTEAI